MLIPCHVSMQSRGSSGAAVLLDIGPDVVGRLCQRAHLSFKTGGKHRRQLVDCKLSPFVSLSSFAVLVPAPVLQCCENDKELWFGNLKGVEKLRNLKRVEHQWDVFIEERLTKIVILYRQCISMTKVNNCHHFVYFMEHLITFSYYLRSSITLCFPLRLTDLEACVLSRLLHGFERRLLLPYADRKGRRDADYGKSSGDQRVVSVQKARPGTFGTFFRCAAQDWLATEQCGDQHTYDYAECDCNSRREDSISTDSELSPDVTQHSMLPRFAPTTIGKLFTPMSSVDGCEI